MRNYAQEMSDYVGQLNAAFESGAVIPENPLNESRLASAGWVDFQASESWLALKSYLENTIRFDQVQLEESSGLEGAIRGRIHATRTLLNLPQVLEAEARQQEETPHE